MSGSHGDTRLFVALNLSDTPRTLRLPDGAELVRCSCRRSTLGPLDGSLRANEGIILRLED